MVLPYDLIDSVVLEEMLHMGLVCNMLTAIGSTPQIVLGYQQITYPGPHPGGVPTETNGLFGWVDQGLSRFRLHGD